MGAASIRHDFVFLRGLYKYVRLEWGLALPCPTDDVSAPPPPNDPPPPPDELELELEYERDELEELYEPPPELEV